jgi:hypothetical protein
VHGRIMSGEAHLESGQGMFPRHAPIVVPAAAAHCCVSGGTCAAPSAAPCCHERPERTLHMMQSHSHLVYALLGRTRWPAEGLADQGPRKRAALRSRMQECVRIMHPRDLMREGARSALPREKLWI